MTHHLVFVYGRFIIWFSLCGSGSRNVIIVCLICSRYFDTLHTFMFQFYGVIMLRLFFGYVKAKKCPDVLLKTSTFVGCWLISTSGLLVGSLLLMLVTWTMSLLKHWHDTYTVCMNVLCWFYFISVLSLLYLLLLIFKQMQILQNQ